MEFTLEHKQIRETTRKFVENEINPFIPEWEESGRAYRDLRVVAIGGGADEIMCGIIAKLKGLNPR